MMFHNRKILNSAGGEYDVYGSGHDRGLYEFDHGQYSHIEEVFFACGCAMLVRRDILKDIGLFDSRYFMYGEDVDLCWRARLGGYKVVYVPSAIVYHKYGGTMEALTAQRLYFTNRNSLCSILKNYSAKFLAKAFLRFFSLKAGEILLFFISGRANASFALLKAILWNITNFDETWKKRRNVQMLRKVSDNKIEQMMVKKSIELRRFLQGYFPKFKA
jgi:GT2 family glycosyltransferase